MTAIAARVAADKLATPEKFCPVKKCLYRTGDGRLCPKHAKYIHVPEFDRKL